LEIRGLKTEQINFVIAAINRYSKGQHPDANENNLKHFETAYVLEILETAKKNVKPEYQQLVQAISVNLTKPQKRTFWRKGEKHVRIINCPHKTEQCFLNTGLCCCGCKFEGD